jgi:hypothetical protein
LVQAFSSVVPASRPLAPGDVVTRPRWLDGLDDEAAAAAVARVVRPIRQLEITFALVALGGVGLALGGLLIGLRARGSSLGGLGVGAATLGVLLVIIGVGVRRRARRVRERVTAEWMSSS